jgi:2-C-methyl-D-erythritol 4-phosphate cytidylyltransferase
VRFGRPKQFEILAGRPVISWSVDAARSVADVVIAVLPAHAVGDPNCSGGADRVVAGGATRSASVRAGLALVPDEVAIIVVHDAARPLASPALFREVIDAVQRGASGAVPGLALTDTVKRVADGVVVETLDRSTLVAVQTPQAFAHVALRRAHEATSEATDDAALIEALGLEVAVVPGEAANAKLTAATDLETMARALARTATEGAR